MCSVMETPAVTEERVDSRQKSFAGVVITINVLRRD